MLWLRSAFFAVLLPGTVVGWVPLWLSTLPDGRFDIGAARWLGLPFVVVGAAGLAWCIWDFGRVGRGTLAPVDPPRFVVRSGLYQYVRNPMYICVLCVVVGEALLIRSYRLLAWGGAVALAFHLFVLLYEEPMLRREFGSEYQEYRSVVGRWLPRRRSS